MNASQNVHGFTSAAASSAAAESVGRGDAGDEMRLVRAAQSGDVHAMQTLLARHEPALLSLCRGMLNHATDAEDAAQETFLRVLRVLARPHGYRGAASFRTYLLRIGINVCIDAKRARRGFAPLSETETLAAPGPGPENDVLLRLRLQEALSVLPPRHRALIILREQDGYSADEIAEILRWNTKKVHNELFKARQTLLKWREKEDR